MWMANLANHWSEPVAFWSRYQSVCGHHQSNFSSIQMGNSPGNCLSRHKPNTLNRRNNLEPSSNFENLMAASHQGWMCHLAMLYLSQAHHSCSWTWWQAPNPPSPLTLLKCLTTHACRSIPGHPRLLFGQRKVAAKQSNHASIVGNYPRRQISKRRDSADPLLLHFC